MVKFYAILAVAGLGAGAFVPVLAAKKPPPNPNDLVMASVPWRIKAGWKDPLSYPLSEYACMAEAIYFEARGEPETGQEGVGHVILNRTRSQGFPQSICGVIRQRGGGIYQFSYRANPIVFSDYTKRREAERIAVRVLEHKDNDPTHGALYYFNPVTADAPAFHNALKRKPGMASVTIGRHEFIYKERRGVDFAAYLSGRTVRIGK